MKWLRFSSILLAGMALLLLAACGQGAATPEPVKYTIEMTEYSFTPNEIQAKVGQEVTIELVNKGLLVHELMLGRDVAMHDNHPNGYEHDLFEEASVEPAVMGGMDESMEMESGDMEQHSGFMLAVPVGGENATMTFTVTKDMVGEWEMGCFEQDGVHYQAGMKGKLIVSE